MVRASFMRTGVRGQGTGVREQGTGNRKQSKAKWRFEIKTLEFLNDRAGESTRFASEVRIACGGCAAPVLRARRRREGRGRSQ